MMLSKTLLVFSLVASVILLVDAKSLSKRQVGGNVPGGFSQINVDDAEVKEIALFAAQTLSSSLNGDKPLSVVKIVKAQSQVVAGTNYQLELVMGTETGSTISCEVTVFDQSWTNTRQVTKSACKPEPVKVQSKRSVIEEAQPVLEVKTEEVKPVTVVVHQPISGGYQPADVNSEEIKEMAAFATESLSSALNSGKPMTLVEITEAKRQFVGGVNYNLDLVMKGENGRVTCSVSMHEHKHDNIRKINEFACKPEPAFVSVQPPAASVKRSANEAKEPLKSGGYKEVSIDDEQVKEMALFAAAAVSSETNAGPIKLHKIVKAERQVVAGANYKLTIELASGDEHQLCEVIVFDQSWTNTRKLSESKCGPKKV